jgi:hypothetical protein
MVAWGCQKGEPAASTAPETNKGSAADQMFGSNSKAPESVPSLGTPPANGAPATNAPAANTPPENKPATPATTDSKLKAGEYFIYFSKEQLDEIKAAQSRYEQEKAKDPSLPGLGPNEIFKLLSQSNIKINSDGTFLITSVAPDGNHSVKGSYKQSGTSVEMTMKEADGQVLTAAQVKNGVATYTFDPAQNTLTTVQNGNQLVFKLK